MIIIDITKNNNEGRWFDFADGVSALILPYRRSLVRKTLREAAVPVVREVAGNQVGSVETDPDLWDRQLYRNIVKDIKGLISPAGAPVAISDDVVDLVCDQVEGFAGWALQKSQELAQETAAKTEAETKNLKRSRGGKKTAPEA